MNKELVEKLIKELAKRIRKDIDGSTYYGLKLDMDNEDHLLVATYFLGTQKDTI